MGKTNLSKEKIIFGIEKNKKEIKKLGVKKIGIFGSFVKNKQRKNSDIDFLVEMNNSKFDNYAKLYFLLRELFNRKIDLVVEKALKKELNYIKAEVEYAKI